MSLLRAGGHSNIAKISFNEAKRSKQSGGQTVNEPEVKPKDSLIANDPSLHRKTVSTHEVWKVMQVKAETGSPRGNSDGLIKLVARVFPKENQQH